MTKHRSLCLVMLALLFGFINQVKNVAYTLEYA